MMVRRIARQFIVGACLIVAFAAAAEENYAGSIVETVAPFFAAERGGIQVADRIEGWSYQHSPDDIQPLSGPFALRLLEREVHPITPVVLHGLRGDSRIALTPGNGRWRLGVVPVLRDPLAKRFEAVMAEVDLDVVERDAKVLANDLMAEGDDEGAAWLWFSLTRIASSQGQWSKVSDFHRNALASLTGDEFRAQKGMIHYFLASSMARQNQYAEAAAGFEQAMTYERSISADRLAIAASKVELGRMARRQSDLDGAQELLDEALELQQRLAPGSLVVAATNQELGRVQLALGEMDAASASFTQAYELANEQDPGGVAAAGYVTGLGIVSYMQGDLASAEEHWEKALEMKMRLEPDSKNVGSVMLNMGLVKRDRGDLREAERYYRAALEITEKLEPDSTRIATNYNNLGSLALEQGDLRNAEYYHRRAYDVRSVAIPGSLDLAVTLQNLGNVARESGQYDKASQFYYEALAIQERVAPNTSEHARILAGLGVLSAQLNQPDEARQFFERSMTIFKGVYSKSADVAEIASHIGELQLEQSDLEGAFAMYSLARDILIEVAPSTFRSARAWHGLARVAQQRGNASDTRAHFEKAIEALETQQLRLGGSDESRSRVKARFVEIYKDYIEFLLDIDEPESAFEILERSRAKELSNMLLERDLVFAADIPADLERERRVLARRYETAQSSLYGAREVAQQEELRGELLAVRREQDAVQRSIRDQSPGLSELRYPSPRSFSEHRDSIPAGTAVVSFNVDAASTDVFVVDVRGDLTVQRLGVGRQELADLTRRLRFLLDAGRWDSEPGAPLLDLAADIYRKILEPLEAAIRDAEVLMIVPDAELVGLPFAALRRSADGDEQYLVEWKPSLIINSLNVFAQLENRSSNAAHVRLVAFGDPDYTNVASGASNAALRFATDRGRLQPLPWTATEVRSIAEVYQGEKVILTGAAATEERAKSVPADTRFLHFATHATLDELHPLDAAIVLSTPGDADKSRENGFLHAWEIYESVRINAELVTLSGCETALGSAFPGEGLIGLTRAFHYAGASSVLASLWSVNDRSTSDLMIHLYRAVNDQHSLARALQAAQLAMIRGEEPVEPSFGERIKRWIGGDEGQVPRQHPYHWAGFILNGRGE